jgi:hypothetical protein
MVDVRDDGKVPDVPLIHEDTNKKLYHSHFFHLNRHRGASLEAIADARGL